MYRLAKGLVLVCSAGCALGCTSAPADQARFHNQEGVIRLNKQDYPGAKAQFESALAVDPGNVDAQVNLAIAAQHAGNLKLAERTYREVLTKHPTRIDCQRGLAALLLVQGRQAEAGDVVRQAVDRQPEAAAVRAEYGWYLRETGNLPEAQAQLQHALSLDPNQVVALVEMGRLYETYHFPDRAKSLYEQALAREPANEEAKARLASLQSGNVKAVPDAAKSR